MELNRGLTLPPVYLAMASAEVLLLLLSKTERGLANNGSVNGLQYKPTLRPVSFPFLFETEEQWKTWNSHLQIKASH